VPPPSGRTLSPISWQRAGSSTRDSGRLVAQRQRPFLPRPGAGGCRRDRPALASVGWTWWSKFVAGQVPRALPGSAPRAGGGHESARQQLHLWWPSGRQERSIAGAKRQIAEAPTIPTAEPWRWRSRGASAGCSVSRALPARWTSTSLSGSCGVSGWYGWCVLAVGFANGWAGTCCGRCSSARVARSPGTPVPQIALAWLLKRQAVTSVTIGAYTVEQLTDNLGMIDVRLTDRTSPSSTRSARPLPTQTGSRTPPAGCAVQTPAAG